jgi:hypothetical protein
MRYRQVLRSLSRDHTGRTTDTSNVSVLNVPLGTIEATTWSRCPSWSPTLVGGHDLCRAPGVRRLRNAHGPSRSLAQATQVCSNPP